MDLGDPGAEALCKKLFVEYLPSFGRDFKLSGIPTPVAAEPKGDERARPALFFPFTSLTLSLPPAPPPRIFFFFFLLRSPLFERLEPG